MRRASPAEARLALRRHATARGKSFAQLSRLVGRRNGYISEHIRLGRPFALPDAERGKIARFLGIDVRELGGDPIRE